jgi:BioD-like phosphotransacetylase family protein
MPVLHVIGDRPGVGKTCIIGALLSRLAQEGRPAAYWRPFSASPQADPDTAFFARYLPQADPGAPGAPLPQLLPRPGQTPALDHASAQAVAGSLAALQAAVSLVLVEGPDLAPEGGTPSPLAAELASRLEARVLLVFQYSPGLGAAQVAQAAAPLGGNLAGMVINGVTRHRRQQALGLLAELRGQGLPALGAIPEDRAMLAVTVNQVADHLAGRFMDEADAEKIGEAWVERFLIGGNIMDSGTLYFGRLPNQAVITRAVRPDIQLAALTPNTRCLVLTGGGDPPEYIQVEARQRSVPLILTPGDTQATAAALDGLLGRAGPHSPGKLARFRLLMEQHLDMSALEHSLG